MARELGLEANKFLHNSIEIIPAEQPYNDNNDNVYYYSKQTIYLNIYMTIQRYLESYHST